MNKLKKYFELAAILAALSTISATGAEVCADQTCKIATDEQTGKAAQELASQTKIFEKLIEEVLNAPKPSTKTHIKDKLFFNGLLKVVMPLMALAYVLMRGPDKDNAFLPLIFSTQGALIFDGLFPLLVRAFPAEMHEVSYSSLQPLMRLRGYVERLSPEQKNELAIVFKKYKDSLNEKIMQDMDGKNLKVVKGVEVAIEVMLPFIWLLVSKFKLKVETNFMWFCSAYTVLDYIAIAYRTYYSTDRLKATALQKIEASLK